MSHHPECGPGEKFLGNIEAIPEYLANIEGLRLGKVSFYLDGPVIPAELGYQPMFANGSAAAEYDRIMMARFRAVRGWGK